MLSEILEAIEAIAQIPNPETRYRKFREFANSIDLGYSQILHLMALYHGFNQSDSNRKN
jgi:hypothetical protein